MVKYTIVIEKTSDGYGAYAPDLGACGTVGSTIEEVKANMVEAIALHLSALVADGLPIPEPATQAAEVIVDQFSSAA